MKKFKLYQRIAGCVVAMENCRRSENAEWLAKHRETIEQLVRDFMPSGSGIDNGTKFDFDQSNGSKLVFNAAFHHMNEHGFYTRWTHHIVIATPSFDGIDLRVTGQSINDIKEYLAEIFGNALDQEIEEVT